MNRPPVHPTSPTPLPAPDPTPKELQELLLYHRTVLLRGEITYASGHRVIMQLLYLNSLDPIAPIQLEVDSAGGILDDALAVYDIVRYLEQDRRRVVRTHAAGRAEGAAALIAAGGTAGHRTAAMGAAFRLTPCYSVAPGPPGAADPELDRSDDMLAGLFSARTGQSKAACLAAMRARQTFTAAEAVAWGLVDAIATA